MSLRTSDALVLGVFLVWAHASAKAQADCAGPEDSQTPECRSWINSNRPIFAARDGKLFKSHFNSTHRDVLIDHGFKSLRFSLSADTRYIVYVGDSGDRASAFIYDNADASDHPLPIADARPLEPEFSSDSSKLAWADVSPQGNHQDIVIMNLADRSTRSIHYPVDVRTLDNYQATAVHWSLDGRQLLVGSIADPKRTYFRINLTTQVTEAIDGRYLPYSPSGNSTDAGMHFSDHGHELEYYRQPCLQWQCQNQGTPAAGESLRIYNNHMMAITTAAGVERVVARGGCEQCGDASLKVLSWLEAGKYLVYQLQGATYIYGVAEDRTSRLFDAGWQFGWRDDESRLPSSP